jgi:hypothetical protein
MSAPNLQAARDAVAYVHQKLVVGSSNKPRDVIASLGGSVVCVLATRSVEIATGDRDAVLGLIRADAAKAEHVGCGNCGESAALAFMYLYDRHVHPLDFMAGQNVDHAFVVIGRLASSDEAKPDSWGPDAVVCDPWGGLWMRGAGRAFPASQFKTNMYKGMMLMPESVYRID